jgi:hypothetical protein
MTNDLFAIDAAAQLSEGYIDGQIPYLTIDNIFAQPSEVRTAALALPFSQGTAHYPGRVARFPPGNPSLTELLRKLVELVTREYLPRLPALQGGERLTRVRGVDTDFAIIDRHPSELSAIQRAPHTDAVPVFGLVYLNEEPRGGTLFFKPRRQVVVDGAERSGYPKSDEQLEVCGHIHGRFNRLAIYPGFVHHSGEIDGEWIESHERYTSPRLTQRIAFFF